MLDGRAVQTYREGDRCGGCGHWWWKDGLWHSLVPILWADREDDAQIVECPYCQEAVRG